MHGDVYGVHICEFETSRTHGSVIQFANTKDPTMDVDVPKNISRLDDYSLSRGFLFFALKNCVDSRRIMGHLLFILGPSSYQSELLKN